tara:strand:- start:47 stop:544 length:498 start_codon:yes stop_codon:yes gene_type:complete
MTPTSVVVDDVLDSKYVSEIYKSIEESTKNSLVPTTSTFYQICDNHLYDDLCLSVIKVAGQFYDLSSSIGYEFWTRLNTKPSRWHQDSDVELSKKGILKFPLCSIVYYCHVENLCGGQLCIESDVITPKTNRMVIFAPGLPHYVEDFTGDRVSILINPWDRYVGY